MPDVLIHESVPLLLNQAFDVYVEQMDIWWPRRGVFPYSFAPESTRPLHIRFESEPGGRYYESFADGSEYTIGKISIWDPPAQLAYSWRDPTWPGSTTIDIGFEAAGDNTLLTYSQDGFAAAGVAWLVPYYRIGCEQTLAAYLAHCRALRKLQALDSQD